MELLDLETSFSELSGMPVASHLILPINANLENFKSKIEKLKFPLWIKLNSSEHKLKLGAVKKAYSFQELEKIHKQLKKQFSDKKFILQENIEGMEIIAGIKHERVFGKVLMLGTGGSYAEIFKDICFRICPLNKEEIFEAIKELKIYKILEEKNYKLDALINLIYIFSNLKIEEADLNPIIVNEKEVKVVDARVSIEGD